MKRLLRWSAATAGLVLLGMLLITAQGLKNFNLKALSQLNSLTQVVTGQGLGMGVQLHQHWTVECVRAGQIIWTESYDNLVVTTGLNKYLDATLKTGLAAPAWYVGLKNSGTVVAGDTMASHSGWTVNSTFSNATLPAFTPGTVSAGSVDNSASKAVFNINGSTTIYGAYLTDNSAVGGATGTLLGAGDFGSSRAVISGDTLNVTITCSIS
jgi:hypothetical protein